MSEDGLAKPALLRIAVTGSSGLVGTRLAAFLTARGHHVRRVVRRPPDPDADEISWDPTTGRIDAAALQETDCLVHLAGDNVAAGRWTQARKDAIRTSRVAGTRLLSETLAKLANAPRTLIAASAIGYYGDRGDETLTEGSPPGTGFLADVCRQWEAATEPAKQAGIRVVNLRIGLVLSAAGGALAKMLTPFKLGLGGVVGSGRQYLSWIALDDLVAAVHHLIVTEDVSGPVNAVSPNPVTNREFTKTLGRVLRRPTILPLPTSIIRLLFGEMGRALLLAGARVRPTKLQATGFEFSHPRLDGALCHELGKTQT
ncbi:MAG TPA: TIGR01777 family oxidoreductase [Phycisphaerae bacterium]|nr:TIGR01777 family oxidoreductase [Phycisphaerae bacterium]